MTVSRPADVVLGLGRRPEVADATQLLSAFLVLLLAVPSQLVVGPLGAAGSPAQLFGLALLLWWLITRLLQVWPRAQGGRGVRLAAGGFLVAVLLSYTAACLRPIAPVELTSADRGLLSALAWCGPLLAACDGVRSRAQLDVLLRRTVLGVGLLSALGLVQFFVGEPLVDRISVPGLVANQDLVGALTRGGFTRPAGTATHPIEFGVVLTLALPLALHLAMGAAGRSWRRWWPVITIAVALPISLSRSALVGAVVVLVVLVPSWTSRQRRRAGPALAVLAACLYVSVPGILGTLTGLFTGLSDDGSARSRTDSYSLAFDFVGRAPVLGRGFATFLPSYRILDNQYLGLLIETGLLGLAALLGLFAASLGAARSARRHATTQQDRSLGLTLVASTAAGVAGFATFDAFGFPMVPGLLFLLVGLSGAAARLVVAGGPTAS